jgi:hypothetical protein
MKPTTPINLVLLTGFALLCAACIPIYSPPPPPTVDARREAAEIAQATAAQLGYTPENRLTEIDQCGGPPCFYTVYFITTDDATRFEARLKANGLVDPEPYEVIQDVTLFMELADSRTGQANRTGKYYLPEFENERGNFLIVNGENPLPDVYGPAPLHSTMWQFQREMAPDSYGNLNAILYEVSQVADRYTFADKPITGNIVAIGVQHTR